jgi:ATP-binding cassette subfamily B protein
MSEQAGLEAFLDFEEQQNEEMKIGTSHFETRAFGPLVQMITRHKLPLFSGFMMVVIATLATLVEPWLFGRAIDEAMVPGDWTKLRQFAIVFFGIVCIRIVTTIGQAYLFELLGQRVTHDLRNELFSRLLRLPTSIYDKTPAGRLLTRVTNDIASLAEMFSAGFVSILSNVFLILGILICLVLLDARVGLIAASVFPGLVVLGVYFSARLRITYRDARSKLSALNAFLAENLLGMKVVQLFNRETLHLSRFDAINAWYSDAQIATIQVFALFQPSITIFAGLSAALVIGFGGEATRHGSMKLGVLVTFFSLVLTLFQPVRELADKWNVFLSGMTSAERIFSLLSWSVETEEAVGDVKSIAGLKGDILFEDVWFAYDDEHWVLKGLTISIPAGTRVGVVGHTGAGKTTLISLLMRFYEPQRGRILLDGKDIRDYDKHELRASIGIIQQEVFLFSGSLEDNVTLWSAPQNGAKALEIVDFAKGKLEERGSNLSMGERQVLAFARALAVSPAIWILDEATANMDSETEDRLQESLGSASKGRTTLLIAHRLATVRSADLILVLHKGILVEEGDHAALMELDGLYARLYRFQEASRNLGLAMDGTVPQPEAALDVGLVGK